MDAIGYTYARTNLAKTMDQVCDDKTIQLLFYHV